MKSSFKGRWGKARFQPRLDFNQGSIYRELRSNTCLRATLSTFRNASVSICVPLIITSTATGDATFQRSHLLPVSFGARPPE